MKPAALRSGIVWVLIVALAIYGYTGALLQIVGPMHRHAQPLAESPVAVSAVASASELALLKPFVQLASTLQHWHERARAQRMAISVVHEGEAKPHVHTHGLFERHHHDGDGSDGGDIEATIVALDAHGSAHAASHAGAASSAALGSATLPLGLSPGLAIPRDLFGRHSPWPRLAAQAWRSAEPKLLERPPCA